VADDTARGYEDLTRLCRALEREVRLRRDQTARDLGQRPGQKKNALLGERADLNPVRHLAIAMTSLEDARLRIAEAARTERLEYRRREEQG
jgi:hypothetical protein